MREELSSGKLDKAHTGCACRLFRGSNVLKKWLVGLLTLLTLTGCGGGAGGIDIFDDGFLDFSNNNDFLLAIDDFYEANTDTPFFVDGAVGVLANDFVCCDDTEVFFPNVTDQGGTLVGQRDGEFLYTPPPGFVGTDTFEYEVEDDFDISIGFVTITVRALPPRGFFVDSINGNDTTGSGQTGVAFATIQAAITAAGTNETITVRNRNNQIYTGTIQLLDGQILVGDGFENGNSLTATRPRLAGPVFMANGCELRGFRIEANGQTSAVIGANQSAGIVNDCQLVNSTGYAIDLLSAQGNWDLLRNTIENCGGGITADIGGNLALSLLVTDSFIRNNTQSAIRLHATASGDIITAIRDNLFNGNQVGFTVDLRSAGNASFCLDLDDNQNNDEYRLTRNGAIFQVEEVPNLGNINTGTITVVADALQPLNDGDCGF